MPSLRAAAIVAVLVLAGLPARADAGTDALYLTWNDCAGGSGVSALTSACDSEDGDQRLYCAFTLAQPLDQVLGIEVVVDLQSGAVKLPDWWHLEPANPGTGAPAGCRWGMLGASQDFTGETGCTDLWLNRGSALVQGYQPGDPRGGASQARIKATASLPSPTVVSLDDTHMYYGLKIVIGNLKTVEPGGCSGCLEPACLVLNAIWIKRAPGAPGGDRLLETPGPGGANWAVWQGGTALDCTAVPVRRATWGRLKSLYR